MKSNHNVPIVIEQSKYGEKSYDIYSRLLLERTIVLGSEIDEEVASSIVAQLLFLANDGPKKDIFFYINSPGGDVSAGLAIYDTMQYIDPEINTLCIGHAASMAQVLLCAGTAGKRAALPHSRIMMHQVSGGTYGSLPDTKIFLKEMERVNKMLIEIIASHTNKETQQVESDASRDFWMSADEALQYGIIDNVIKGKKTAGRI